MARSTQKRYDIRRALRPWICSTEQWFNRGIAPADLIAMADVEGYDLADMLQVSNTNRKD